jgi:hypothetical protein
MGSSPKRHVATGGGLGKNLLMRPPVIPRAILRVMATINNIIEMLTPLRAK